MKTEYRTISLLPALLFFFILFMTSGDGAYAACADHDNNILRMDVTVSCGWDDEENRDGTRPDHVTVTLYANGRETGRAITLSEENGWSGSFIGMNTYRYGEKLSYSIIEERISGYTGTIEGSDRTGYRIVNIHEPLPIRKNGSDQNGTEKNSSGEIVPDLKVSGGKGVIVETVVTTKVSRSVPARTSTSTKKTRSAKTADTAAPVLWELLMLVSCGMLYMWMRYEQNRE